MARLKIFQQYVFARIDENDEIEYFTPYKGGLKVVYVNQQGEEIFKVNLKPTEADMNAAGWYRLVNVQEEGEDYILDNILYHFVGAVTNED